MCVIVRVFRCATVVDFERNQKKKKKRTNVTTARLKGLEQDLHLSGNE
jgi:hypothetical protein